MPGMAAGPLLPRDPKAERDGYRVEARVYLINLANGSVSSAPQVLSRHAYVEDPDWEDAICKGIGKAVGSQLIPLSGAYTSTGQEAQPSGPAHLGIDGVLELKP